MSLARWVLVLGALPFVGIGLAFLAAPTLLARQVDLDLGSALAQSDVRAVYGGLQLACGALLLGASRRREWLRPGLWALVWLYTGLAGARGLSWFADGSPGAFGLALQAGEVAAIACGVLALRSPGLSSSRGHLAS